MSMTHSDKILHLVKLDAVTLYENIKGRFDEYLSIFSVKRDRAHFKEIFFSRIRSLTMQDLAVFSIEEIDAINAYYKQVDEMNWYLSHTEDMPNTVKDNMRVHVKHLDRFYVILCGYFDRRETALEIEVVSSSPAASSQLPPLPADEI